MVHKLNPRQLVLRRDSATGLTLVGWDTDLPVGRFEHLELIAESAQSQLPGRNSEYFTPYQSALLYARNANHHMLEQQVRDNRAKGWYRVPFKLAKGPGDIKPDNVGNYASAAMELLYQLTRNRIRVWVIIQQGEIEHVRARYPKQELDELTYQVWYHKQRHELNMMAGSRIEGTLIVCESGLWCDVKR